MVNKLRDMRDRKNMKEVHKVATCFAVQIPTQCSVQDSALSALVVCFVYSASVVVYWYVWIYTRMNNPLNPFVIAQDMDFLIIRLIILISIMFLGFPVLLLEK